MTIKKVKSILIISLYVLITILFSTIIFYSYLKDYNNQEMLNVQAAVAEGTYSSGSGTKSNPYIIKTTAQLNKLATNVNEGSYSMPGKEIFWKLGNNLDYNNSSYIPLGYTHPFYGNIDGNGYSIKNITIDTKEFTSGSSNSNVGIGIIGHLNGQPDCGIIKNLYVQNMTVYLRDVEYATIDIGGITGRICNATVSNCRVSGIYVNIIGKTEANGQCGVGGIYSVQTSNSGNSAVISNCQVEDIRISKNGGSLNKGFYVVGIGYNSYNTSTATRISNCYFSGFNDYDIDDSLIEEKYDINYKLYSTNNKNCYSGTNSSYTFDSCNSNFSSTGSVWFYNTNYSPVPYLRQFLNWGKLTFSASTGGTVSLGSLEIPELSSYTLKNLQSNTLKIYGNTITATANTGYKFKNWTISGYSCTANFQAETYAITYNYNGGSGNNPTTYTASDSITLANPTKSGYSFTGWTGSNGSTPQTSVTIPKGSTGNKSYTANWTINTYTISYALNDGSVSSSNPTEYTVETEGFTLNNPTRTGYTFTGWTGSNGSTPQTSVTIPKGSTGNKSYTANWTLFEYSITYILNGGSVSSSNPSKYTVETESFTLNNPTRTGYTFTGWTGSNGTTAQTSVTIQKGSSGNKTYTANWEITKIEITFNLVDGAIMTINNITQSTNYKVTVFYNQEITTTFDGVNNLYSYKLNSIDEEEITITYNPQDNKNWISKFNLPNEGDVTSREQPSWNVKDDEIEGNKTLSITPTLSLKKYEIVLD